VSANPVGMAVGCPAVPSSPYQDGSKQQALAAGDPSSARSPATFGDSLEKGTTPEPGEGVWKSERHGKTTSLSSPGFLRRRHPPANTALTSSEQTCPDASAAFEDCGVPLGFYDCRGPDIPVWHPQREICAEPPNLVRGVRKAPQAGRCDEINRQVLDHRMVWRFAIAASSTGQTPSALAVISAAAAIRSEGNSGLGSDKSHLM